MKNGKYCSSKKAMKPLAVLLAMILLVGCAVGGTLAWLTAQTTEVKNTFTSAKLFDNPTDDFTLWEHQAEDPDEDGKYTLNNTEVQANNYKILPGVNIPKDPTVDIVNLQENAYLYIKVNNALATGLSCTIDPAHWTALDATEYPNVYVYSGDKAANNVIAASGTDKKTFTVNILDEKQVVVENTYNGTGECTLSFNAYMVQATGNGANAAEAWENTYGATTNP